MGKVHIEEVGSEVERLFFERKVVCESGTPHLMSTILPFRLLVNVNGLRCRRELDDPSEVPIEPLSELVLFLLPAFL